MLRLNILAGSHALLDPIRVRIKVDDNPVIEAKGKYPIELVVERETLETVLDQFHNGMTARIRTQHGDEQHTFSVSLDGFREATEWAASQCANAQREN